MIYDDPAGRIAVPHVILHVETSLGQVSKGQTGNEGFAPLAQQAKAGQTRMLIGRRTEKLAEPSRSEVLERGRSRTLIVTPGSGDATGNNLGKPNQGRQRQAVKSVFAIWFRNIRASTSFVAILASEGRTFVQDGRPSVAADACKAPWIRQACPATEILPRRAAASSAL